MRQWLETPILRGFLAGFLVAQLVVVVGFFVGVQVCIHIGGC